MNASAARNVSLAGFLTLITCPGYGQVPAARFPMWGWPYGPTSPPNGVYWSNPCYPFCSPSQFQIPERRRERAEELAREQTQPAEPLTQYSFPASHGFGAKTPTDADVQPDYRGSGNIRDQFRKSGDFRPEFLDGKVRPSR